MILGTQSNTTIRQESSARMLIVKENAHLSGLRHGPLHCIDASADNWKRCPATLRYEKPLCRADSEETAAEIKGASFYLFLRQVLKQLSSLHKRLNA